MTCPDVLPSVSTNKRKRVSDDDDDADIATKTVKTAEGMTAKNQSSKLALRIVTDLSTVEMKSPTLDELLSDNDPDDADSLFDEQSPHLSTPEADKCPSILTAQTTDEPLPDEPSLSSMIPARRTAPHIRGLFFDPALLLPEELEDELMWKCIRAYFQQGTSNQVMLFERASPQASSSSSSPAAPSPRSPTDAGLPTFLSDLLLLLHDLLRSLVPPETHELLFSPSPASHTGPPRARQAIINLYWPGEGITPHVDLLSRYGDGIIGVSLGSGCAMEFARVNARGDSLEPPSPSPEHSSGLGSPSDRDREDRCALYLPRRSVVVLTEAARYDWAHGIEKRLDDLVEEPGSARSVLLERDVRLSITFRWMLPGAEVVGSP